MGATTTTRRALGLTLGLVEKTILGCIAGAAAAVGIVTLVFLAQRIVELAVGTETTLFDVVLAEPLAPAFDSPAVVAASADTATLTVVGLPDAARGALIGAAVAGSLVTIGVCTVLAWLCLRVFVGRPFVRSASWGIGVVAVLVLVSGLGVPLLTGIAHAETGLALGLDELAPFSVKIDLAPIGWCFALAVVGAAFEIGQRLQRDTEGLV